MRARRWMSRRRGWIAAAVAIAAALALYAPVLDGPFIFDDVPQVVRNPGVRSMAAALHSGYQETRPLHMLSLAATYAVAGMDPFAFRLVNVLLHAACAWLLWAGLRRAVSRGPLPELAAAVFLAHPVATEGVAYVHARSGILAAACTLGAIALYARWRSGAGGRAAYAGSVACTAAAMLSKESAVVAPVVTWLWAAAFLHAGDVRAAWRREARALIPHALCAGIVPLLFAVATNPHTGTFGFGVVPWVAHALTQVRAVAYLAGLVVVPVANNIDYDFALSTGPDGAVLASAAVLAAAIGGAIAVRRRAPAVAAGVVWFFVALAPTNSLVPFKDILAERLAYLSLAGAAVALGWAGARIAAARRLAWAAIAAYLVALAALTVARNRVLADPVALWTQTVAASPAKARPHINLGIALAERGDLDAAGAAFSRALELAPGDHYAHYNMGVWLERRGDLPGAIAEFRAAVRLAPRDAYRAALARAATRLGVAAFRAGDAARAEALWREAIAADPRNSRALYNLSRAHLARGDRAGARELLARAVAADPSYERARRALAELDGNGPPVPPDAAP